MSECRAKITTFKPRYLEKAWTKTFKVRDAYNKNITSSLSLFIPKLTPKYQTPCIFLHVSNAAGTCLIRLADPKSITSPLEFIINLLRSDNFIETWREINFISEKLGAGEDITLDEKLLDKNAWHQLAAAIDISGGVVYEKPTKKKNQLSQQRKSKSKK